MRIIVNLMIVSINEVLSYNDRLQFRLWASTVSEKLLISKKDCEMSDRDYQEIRIIEFILEALSYYL